MKKRFTFILSIITLSAMALMYQGCSSSTMQKADELKNRRMYVSAGDMYTKIAAGKSKKVTNQERLEATAKAAECYRKANEFKKAKRAYEKLLRKDPKNTEALYYLGLLTMKEVAEETNINTYKTAKEYFQRYLNEVPGDEGVMRKVASCDSAESWLTQESRFIVTNFKEVNSKFCDFSPMIADKKDNLLYFVTDREGGAGKKIYGGTGNFFTDIWSIEKEKGKRGMERWGKPQLVPGEINAKYNDGVQDFDRRYSTIYFTRCNGTDGKSRFCKIYEAKKRGTEWVEVTVLPFCEQDSANFAHPTLTPDGNKMYFSSDLEGGYGGYDLYVVNFVKRGKTWSSPINLGKVINTEKDEMFPYFNFHDEHLYFSSNGHIGLGGLDIFKSQGSGEEWLEPENLKFPLNSGADDFGITFDNGNPFHGFFSSNRAGGRGCDDIYEFNIQPLYFRLVGTVTDCKTGLPLANALVEITNDLDTVKLSLRTNEDGDYDTVVLAEKATYEIVVTHRDAYYFDADDNPRVITTVGLKKSHTFIEDFCLNPQLDFARVLPIFYDLDKANIKPAAAKVLSDSLLPLLQKYPKIRIELGSHTDCRSSYAYNISLSQRRADSAVAYLVSKGIDARRIVARGYGESSLINDCACEGRDIVKVTKLEVGKNKETGQPLLARKKIEQGELYSYKEYTTGEIQTINGEKFVACDEFQHSQNRRTTFRILDVDFDPNMKMAESNDPNNVNAKIVIVKLEKEGKDYKGPAVGNMTNPVGHSLFIESDKLEISVVELKNLIEKNAVKPDDVKGATLQQIGSGRVPPGTTVTLNKLTIGTKESNKTYENVTLEVNSFPASFRLGFNAMKKEFNATFDEEEAELALTTFNKQALMDGPIGAKLTEQKAAPERDWNAIEGVVKVKVVVEGGVKYLSMMLNDVESVMFAYDFNGKNTWVDQSTAARLFATKVIGKKDFDDGTPFKAEGVKFPSPQFTINKMEVGTATATAVKFKISDKAEVPTVGRAFFKNFKEYHEQDGYVYLVPKPSRASR